MTPQAKARKGKKKKSRPVGGNTLSISVPSGPVAPPASSYGSVHHKEQENCSSVGSSLQHQSPREYDDSGHNREGAVARSPSVKRALNGGVFLEAMDIKILRKFMMEEWGGGTDFKPIRVRLSSVMKRIGEIECGVCRRRVLSVVNEILNESSNHHHQPAGEHHQVYILVSKGVALAGVKDNESRGGGYFEFRPVVDGGIVTATSKRGGGALELFQTIWQTLKENEAQSRSIPVQEITLGSLDRVLRSHLVDEAAVELKSVPSSVSCSPWDPPVKFFHPKTTTTDGNVCIVSKDSCFMTKYSASDVNLVHRFEKKCSTKEAGSAGALSYSPDSPQKMASIKTTTFNGSASTPGSASMCLQADMGIATTAFSMLGVGGRGPGEGGDMESDNKLLLFKAETSLEKGYRGLQESFKSLQYNVTEFEKNGKSDFNPAFTQLQTVCEGSIYALFQKMTSMLHTLSLLAGIGFLAGGRDPAAEAEKWVSIAWSEYESCLSALFEIVMNAQEAKLRCSGTFSPIFPSLNEQVQALSVVESKKEILDNLYSTISDILQTPHVRSLFVKLDHVYMQCDSVLHNDSMYRLDDKSHIVLMIRVEMLETELRLFMTGKDLLISDLAMESKLSTCLSDWEKYLDKMKGDVLEHGSIALAAGSYSQGPVLRLEISESEKLFKEQWDKDNESREFKQSVAQSEVSDTADRIAQLKHRAVGLDKREHKQEKVHKKNVQQDTLNSPDHNPSIFAQLKREQGHCREVTARELEHNANEIELCVAHQNHFKSKYSLLMFLTSVLYRRYMCMRTFSAITHARILARSAQENLLCGDKGMGEKRLAILAISALTEEVHESAIRWNAKRAAMQLIEDEEREETRRRKKDWSDARRKGTANSTCRKEHPQLFRDSKIGSGSLGMKEEVTASNTTCSSSSHSDDTSPHTELSLTDMSNSYSVKSLPYHNLHKKQVAHRISQYGAVVPRVDNEGWEVLEEESQHDEGFVNTLSRFQKAEARRKGEREKKEKEKAGKEASPFRVGQSTKELHCEEKKVHATRTTQSQQHCLNKEHRKGMHGGEGLRDSNPVNGGIEGGGDSSVSLTQNATAEMRMRVEPSPNGITSTTTKKVVVGDVTTSKEYSPPNRNVTTAACGISVKECISTEESSRGVAMLGNDSVGAEAAAHITSISSVVLAAPDVRALTPPESKIDVEMTSKQSLDKTIKLDPSGADVQQKMEVEMCGDGAASTAISQREGEGISLGFSSAEDLPRGMCIRFGTVETSSEDPSPPLMSHDSRNTDNQESPAEEHIEKEEEVEDREEICSTRIDGTNRNAHEEQLEHTEKEVDDRREELDSTAMKAQRSSGSISKLKCKKNEEADISAMQATTVVVDEMGNEEAKNAVRIGEPVSDPAVDRPTSSPQQHSYSNCITDNNFTTVQEVGSGGINQPDEDCGLSHHQQPIIAYRTMSDIMPSNTMIVEKGGGVGAQYSGPQYLSSPSPPQLVLPVVTAPLHPGQHFQQPSQYVLPAQYQSTPGGYNYHHHHVLQQQQPPYVSQHHVSHYPVMSSPYMAYPGGPYLEMPCELPQGYFPQQIGEVGAHHVLTGPGAITHGGQVWICHGGGPQWNMSPLVVPQRTPVADQQQAAYMQQLQMGSGWPSTARGGIGQLDEHYGKNRKWKSRVGGGSRARGRRKYVNMDGGGKGARCATTQQVQSQH